MRPSRNCLNHKAILTSINHNLSRSSYVLSGHERQPWGETTCFKQVFVDIACILDLHLHIHFREYSNWFFVCLDILASMHKCNAAHAKLCKRLF